MREVSKSEKLFIFRLIVVIMGINLSISLYEYGFDGTRLLITVLVSAVVVPVISILFLLLFGKKRVNKLVLDILKHNYEKPRTLLPV